jgi:hypothetical protein
MKYSFSGRSNLDGGARDENMPRDEKMPLESELKYDEKASKFIH